jgi:hypothetical protein
MKKMYLKILLGLIGLLWLHYLIQHFLEKKRESFVPKIQSMCRPYVRNINQSYESFINNYGPDVIMTKLKKWNIY